jgi:basic membrane protein A
MRKKGSLFALLLAFLLLAAACGDSGTTTTGAASTEPPATTQPPETTPPETTPPETTPPETRPPITDKPAPSICQVSDVGGIDDKSFNESAWNGALQAGDELGSEVSFLESQDATDFRPNIDAFIDQGCDLIVTVGFLLAQDTADAAVDNPDQLFAIVDQSPGPFPPWADDAGELRADFLNLRGLTFQTDEAAFLAGYLAAAVSETGVVGTFGGINIPPVTIFMDGFVNGVTYYNFVKGTDVTALGWDPATQEGLFTNNFESLEDGRAFAQNLLDEGADIIHPVAGPVGLGSAGLCTETGSCLIVGVDADQFLTDPANAGVYLTSVLKNIAVSIFNTAVNVKELGSVGNTFLGTLANDGVGLADFHDNAGLVSSELQAELDQLRADIISGAVVVSNPLGEEEEG